MCGACFDGSDPELLSLAVSEGLVLLTHDRSTLTADAHARLASGEFTPGIFVTKQGAPIGILVEEILTIEECNEASEWENRVTYLPL